MVLIIIGTVQANVTRHPHLGTTVAFVSGFALFFHAIVWSARRGLSTEAMTVIRTYPWTPVTLATGTGPGAPYDDTRLIAPDGGVLVLISSPLKKPEAGSMAVWFAGDLRVGGYYVVPGQGLRPRRIQALAPAFLEPSSPETDRRAVETGLAEPGDFVAGAQRTDVEFDVVPSSQTPTPSAIELPRVYSGITAPARFDEQGRVRLPRVERDRLGQTTGFFRVSVSGFETSCGGNAFKIAWSELTHVVLRDGRITGVHGDGPVVPSWDPISLRAQGQLRTIWLSAEAELGSVPGGLPAVAAALIHYARESGAGTRVLLGVDPAYVTSRG
ncbi:hypothetical protein [Yinghuangia seranimata]|uniref:hypothetical protein n=1 Tax=Yinghuangia seranimata TaxID=408067 RepID=UPI00248D2DD1|nr:hypothetical protein [Yinghuangia seranimata]MDI2131459.1 hypothetical protein [Yinghuangia seranimata]